MILSRNAIELKDDQLKLIKSGWGKKAAEDTLVESIVYDSDGYKVKGYIAKPASIKGKLPLIIWNRGGSKNAGRIDEFLARGMFGEIASWGYIVFASMYREEDEFGGRDVNDVLNLIKLADEIPECDVSNIGMEGWSRGGMMTYKALTLTDRIKCAVIISGLADLSRSIEHKSELSKVYDKLFGTDDSAEFKKRLEERSAVHFYKNIDKETALLLIHGTEDSEVSHIDSEEMSERLSKNGNECRLELIEGGDHYLKKHREKVTELRKNWFNRFLK
ncbi:MAG: prolyl oligopeptidase family serine peptidase [Ignavibacteria bacterium]|nr:prolyl oligopeptidase family serine peptidase [Ignavibacteria bacterium]